MSRPCGMPGMTTCGRSMDRPLVDMPECPVVEACAARSAIAERGIVVVAGRTGKARMHQADIDGVRDRRALGRQRACERAAGRS